MTYNNAVKYIKNAQYFCSFRLKFIKKHKEILLILCRIFDILIRHVNICVIQMTDGRGMAG